MNPEAGGREQGLQDSPQVEERVEEGRKGAGDPALASGLAGMSLETSFVQSGFSCLHLYPAFKIESRFYSQTCSGQVSVFEKQNGMGCAPPRL